MEVSAKTFREVEFREKMRGYHPEDVDQFLEQMATEVDTLQDRLRVAIDRAQRAETAAAEAGSSDETLRRTLVLGQRTADMAVQEAREQASRIVGSAEQQAQAIVGEAEDRARRLHGEALADVHAELAKLEATRAQAQQDVDDLTRWAAEHRVQMAGALREALSMIERAGALAPAPSTKSIDVPFAAPRSKSGPRPAQAALPPVAEPPPPPDDRPMAPDGRAGQDGGPATEAVPVDASVAPESSDGARERNPLTEPDEEALDNFFEDGEYQEEPRFGGRLRRRH